VTAQPATTADFSEMLSGGDRRSLGRVDEVIGRVLDQPALFGALFECLFDANEIARMRAGDAVEKVVRKRPALMTPYRARLLTEVPHIQQPSVQWHLAQILARIELTPKQRTQAIATLRRNLDAFDDWIVVNLTLEALAHLAQSDRDLRRDLLPILRRHRDSKRASIAKRATKLLAQLGEGDDR
jgi:hypothetical protein